jgi:DNA adenine methylase
MDGGDAGEGRFISKCPPLLRWAGSKRKLLPRLLAHCPEQSDCYIEPFAGSACLFFSLRPSKAILGDFNPALIGAYKTVQRYPNALFKELNRYPVDRAFYYDMRSKDPKNLTKLAAAARFIYLNRLCFNGVYRTNKRGAFNVPFGSKTGGLPTLEAIRSAADALRNTELLIGDFEDTIQNARKGDFVYMDPPYSASRYRGEYGYGAFSHPDIDRLSAAADRLQQRGVTFLISYKADDQVSMKFSSYFQSRLLVQRHVAGFAGFRDMASEILISNRPFRKARP